MDSQLNKPLTTASPLDKGLHEPLLKKEPLNKPLATPSDKLLAGQSSAAGGISSLPSATGFVTYTESTLEPIITIKEASTAPIITTTTSSSSTLLPEQRLKSASPLSDLERGLNKPLLGEKSPKFDNTGLGYDRKLDTHLDQKLEGPSLSRQAGTELMGNSGETKRLGPVEPAPYPTTVGTGTVGLLPGAEVPANLGATPVTTGTSSAVYPTSHSTGITSVDERAHSPSKLTRVVEDVKVSKHKHHDKTHKHHHDKLSHEEKKNMSNEEKYVLHEREAARADAEGKGVKAAIEDVKAGYRKTEAETELNEGKHHKHHKHGHKKDKTIV
jgi:hypothetical protein